MQENARLSADIPDARSGRRADVQGLRGVAILLVVLYHSGLPVPGGFLGVDVFFVISGFVITTGLLQRLDSEGAFSLRAFYARRIRRLLPAVGVMLLVVCLLAALLLAPGSIQQSAARFVRFTIVWLGNLTAYQMPPTYFDGHTDEYPLVHVWSLSVEEQFYLVFPVLILLTWRWRHRRVAVKAMLWAVTGFSLALTLVWAHGLATPPIGDPQRLTFYSAPTRAWEFGIGALLAAYAIGPGGASRLASAMPRRIMAVAGAAGLAASALFITGATIHPGVVTLVPTLATAALIAADTRFLTTRALVWCGDLSYSWYLWHWPLISLALTLGSSPYFAFIAAILSLPIAWTSYRFVELRTYNPRLGTFVRLRVIAVIMALCVAMSAALTLVSRQNWFSSNVVQLLTETTPQPIAYPTGCAAGRSPAQLLDTPCHYNSGGTHGTVVVVGDSNAAMYADGLIATTKARDQSLIVSTYSDCSLITLRAVFPGFDSDRCLSYVNAVIDDLLSMPPTTVVTATVGRQIAHPEVALQDPTTGDLITDPRERAVMWEASFAAVVQKLTDSGHRVVVIQVIPQFLDGPDDFWRTTKCPTIGVLIDQSLCAPKVPLATLNQDQSLVIDTITAATEQSGATLLDLRARLCPHGTCSPFQNGHWVYRDGTHLSRYGSHQLEPNLAAAIR